MSSPVGDWLLFRIEPLRLFDFSRWTRKINKRNLVRKLIMKTSFLSSLALAAAALMGTQSPSQATLTIVETWITDPGATVKGVWEQVETYYETFFATSYTGETWVVELDWKTLSGGIAEGGWTGTLLKGSDISAYSGSLTDRIFPDAFYVPTLANHLARQEVNTGTTVQMAFDSTTAWDFSTNSTGSGLENFYITAIHELGHGLGFLSNDLPAGGWADNEPLAFDFFLGLGTDGTQPLFGMSNSELASAFVSDNVYWTGDMGNSANNGNPVKIYAPDPYESGSSMSHIDYSVDTTRSLIMFPTDSGMPAFYSYTPLELGMFGDIGYSIVPEPSAIVLLLAGLAVVVLMRRVRSGVVH